jgi:hypothetical protein
MDAIRDALQQVLDAEEGDGWQVAGYVVALNIDRVDSEEVTSAKWWYTPPGQHNDHTDSLVRYLTDVATRTYEDDEEE